MEVQELREIIAANVRECMEAKDIKTVAELSRLANIPQATLSVYMSPGHPKGAPNLRHIIVLANYFAMEPWELLCPVGAAERAVIKSMEAWMRSKDG